MGTLIVILGTLPKCSCLSLAFKIAVEIQYDLKKKPTQQSKESLEAIEIFFLLHRTERFIVSMRTTTKKAFKTEQEIPIQKYQETTKMKPFILEQKNIRVTCSHPLASVATKKCFYLKCVCIL